MLAVSEYFYLRNQNTWTFGGSLPLSRDNPNALHFSLPPGVRALSTGEGFKGTKILSLEDGFVTSAALPPGVSRFAFSFVLPYATSSYIFRFTAFYPATQVSLLVPERFQASCAPC